MACRRPGSYQQASAFHQHKQSSVPGEGEAFIKFFFVVAVVALAAKHNVRMRSN